MSARFRITREKEYPRRPWRLRDRTRPAFVGRYARLDLALLAMDNKLRAEREMPARLPITAAEIRERMTLPPNAHLENDGRTLVVDEPFFPRAEYVEEGWNR